MKTYYRVQADIDLDAIYKNAENAKKLTKPGTKSVSYTHLTLPTTSRV